MSHVKIKIRGKVQGVLFRLSAKQKADELKIFGFAKNLDDGSVYIEAEGEKENLEKFLKWCHQGPILAKVEKVDYEISRQFVNFISFDIKH